MGLLLHAIVHSAGIQDRDGGISLLATLFGQFPFLEKLFADSAYQGPIFAGALADILPRVKVEIFKRCDQVKGFVTLPKRWIVERAIAWLNHRMAEPLSKTGQGLGKPQFHSPPLPALRVHSAHAAKALQWLTNFRDGLLEDYVIHK